MGSNLRICEKESFVGSNFEPRKEWRHCCIYIPAQNEYWPILGRRVSARVTKRYPESASGAKNEFRKSRRYQDVGDAVLLQSVMILRRAVCSQVEPRQDFLNKVIRAGRETNGAGTSPTCMPRRISYCQSADILGAHGSGESAKKQRPLPLPEPAVKDEAVASGMKA